MNGLFSVVVKTTTATFAPGRRARRTAPSARAGSMNSIRPSRQMTASKLFAATSRSSAAPANVVTLASPAARAFSPTCWSIVSEMSLATTAPCVPTRRAASNVWLPAPQARSSTRAPASTAAMASIASVAGSIQAEIVGSHRAHPGAAPSHCCRIPACCMAFPPAPVPPLALADLAGSRPATRAAPKHRQPGAVTQPIDALALAQRLPCLGPVGTTGG